MGQIIPVKVSQKPQLMVVNELLSRLVYMMKSGEWLGAILKNVPYLMILWEYALKKKHEVQSIFYFEIIFFKNFS